MTWVITSMATWHDATAVKRLHRQVRRWCDRSFTFACLTQTPDLLSDEIVTAPITDGWEGGWSVLDAMRPDLFRGACLYLAPSAQVRGPLEDLFTDAPGIMTPTDEVGEGLGLGVVSWQGDMAATHRLLCEYRSGVGGATGRGEEAVMLWHAARTTGRGLWLMRAGLVRRAGQNKPGGARVILP